MASVGRSELLGIGAFALLSGLSIPSLRHYDEMGLLPPAAIDPRTGYRRYSRDQLVKARVIRVLRSVDLPLEEIARVMEAGVDEYLERALAVHRDRLAARAEEVAALLRHTDEILERGICMASTTATARVGEISLIVDDVDKVAAFYREVFDVEFAPDEHEGPQHYHASFGNWPGSDFFMLTIWPAAGDRPSVSHLGFVVDDLDATWARAERAGAQSVTAPRDSDAMPRNAKFLDPGGNHVMLYQA